MVAKQGERYKWTYLPLEGEFVRYIPKCHFNVGGKAFRDSLGHAHCTFRSY